MATAHFTNLLIVAAAGLLAPLALGFFPRLRIPAIVLEILLGIVVGPSVLGWAKPDLPVTILALVGLAFLLFLSGLEFDIERLRGRVLKLTAIGFGVSFAIAIVLGLGLSAAGFVKSPLFVAIVLVATSLGVIFPVLKDSDNLTSSFGQLVIAAASIAEFGSIVLLSLFFSGKGSTSTSATLILLGVFGVVVLLVGLAISGFERSMMLGRVLRRLQHQRGPVRPERPIRERLDRGPDAPLPNRDLSRPRPARARVRAVARALPVGHRGVLEATSLTFIVAATQIGLGLGVVSRASAAALVAAGLLSVAISPTLALVLLRRSQPGVAAPGDSPSPMMPVISSQDRALTRVGPAPSAP